MERNEIVAGRLNTFYLKAGSGFPIVLFHGAAPGACSEINWQPNIEPLAVAGFTVYAYDQPGFGRTENSEDLSIEYRVRHAKAFIEALNLDRYHVVGNSVGGYIAARLALEDARVEKLVTTTSGTLAPKGSAESAALSQKHSEELREYVPSLDNMRALTLGTLFYKELVTEDLVRARYEMSLGKNHEAAERRRGAKPPRPVSDELRRLKSKALLLWGAQDRGVSIERGLLLFQLIPNCEFHLFDQCAHWVQWDQAERFNRLVADFLKQ
ncbi:MAG TPA: alpha/beta hydrolase [Candidatus Binatia bacterium]|jgi:2-hydroxy-6-oxonona-2,4-dienedioate hydrolase